MIKKKESKHTTTKKSSIHKTSGEENGTKELQNNQKAVNKMVIVSVYLILITLNVKGLNSAIKRQSG